MMTTRRLLLVCLALAVFALSPSRALAQDGSHWGVAVSIVPAWKSWDKFKVLWAENAVDIKSKDFSIGIARGRTVGGDWSVSYIRKNFKDGSFADDTNMQCQNFRNGCFRDGDLRIMRSTRLSGLEALKFISFGTIKQRVQIGLTVGGGYGTLKGNVELHAFRVDVTSCNSAGCLGTQRETVSTVGADKDLFKLAKVPLGKVEGAVGVILAPGLKVRVAAGLDFPGQNRFAITGVYLIGAK